jgi:enoyl-CoA hydratase/carnithine racemase
VAAGKQPAKRLSSAGRIATYAEIVIRDLQSGEAVARNEIGEITVRSPSNFSGYHNRPGETANTLHGAWVHTGDVGYVDDDGFLFVVDRVKDMVLSGGMNVSSAEVEAVLAEHPAVQAAAVIGIPDDEWGEIVTGVVTTRPGVQVTEADLIKFSRERLAGYKAPKSIKLIDQLPLNGIGKVLKRELRSRFAPPRTETQARVTPLRSAAMKWTPNTATGPRGYLVETDNLSTLDITMPIDGVAKITLNRPTKLNAFDVAMVGEIRSVIWRMSFDDRVRVIVITGAGRGFCAGRDVGELQAGRALPLPHYRAYTRSNHDMLNDLEAIEKPVIAAINGVCAGGGLELAASCDFRFASAEATFSLPEIFIGVIPASGACSRMIQMIGIENVKDLVMTGRQIDAAEAKSMGFVRRVSEPDKLQDDVLDYARLLMKGAPLAIGIGKHVTNTCQNIDTESGRILERLAQSSLVGSTDSTEGIKSFLEKRPPRFAGR